VSKPLSRSTVICRLPKPPSGPQRTTTTPRPPLPEGGAGQAKVTGQHPRAWAAAVAALAAAAGDSGDSGDRGDGGGERGASADAALVGVAALLEDEAPLSPPPPAEAAAAKKGAGSSWNWSHATSKPSGRVKHTFRNATRRGVALESTPFDKYTYERFSRVWHPTEEEEKSAEKGNPQAVYM
jgi:hypothetical protein